MLRLWLRECSRKLFLTQTSVSVHPGFPNLDDPTTRITQFVLVRHKNPWQYLGNQERYHRYSWCQNDQKIFLKKSANKKTSSFLYRIFWREWRRGDWRWAEVERENRAVLYYTSCWDFVGIKIEIVGMDPNCFRPKPRPTTPHDFSESSLFLYQKET